MNVNKLTKKELAYIMGSDKQTIDRQETEINGLNKIVDELNKSIAQLESSIAQLESSIAQLEQGYISVNRNYQDEKETVSKLKNKNKLAHIQNISDIKSLQNMLMIYDSEAMTHREKAYLGRKLNIVIEKMIAEKLKELNFQYNLDGALPF